MVPTMMIMGNIDNANLLFLEKKFTHAITEYAQILDDDPTNPIALNNIGYALTKIK